MIEELHNASKQLCLALDLYLRVCSAVRNTCLQGNTVNLLPEDAQQIDEEFGRAESYCAMMERAKRSIRIIRNHAISVTPINTLPSEILARIFQIARDAEPRRVDRLALVCARWRSVALGLPSLWSRIDCAPDPAGWFYPKLISRALLHASRSGELPLDFHLSGHSGAYSHYAYGIPIEELCQLVAPQMRSLNLVCDDSWDLIDGGPRVNSIFSSAILGCTLGLFTKLAITAPDRFGFITTEEERRPANSALDLDIDPREFEAILATVTVLHLTGIFPRWTSRAYHGLVDLRLYGCNITRNQYNTISGPQLVSILKASPALRIFHFGLRMIARARESVPAPRVRLTELEVLHFSCEYFDELWGFLSLLEPLPKLLDLAIRDASVPNDMGLSITAVAAFFARSNVTKLLVCVPPQLLTLLSSLPHLKVLMINNGLLSELSADPQPLNSDPRVSFPQLDMCFIPHYSLPLDKLLVLTQRCRPKKLILYGLRNRRNSPEEKAVMELVKEVSAICPEVRVASIEQAQAQYQSYLPHD